MPQLYKEATNTCSEVVIPLRRDSVKGDFWLDYLPVLNPSAHVYHRQLLQAYHTDAMLATCDESRDAVQWHTEPEAAELAADLWAYSGNVTEIFFSRHESEREIKGTKAGLRKKKRDMTKEDFHDLFLHMGDHPNCWICTMVAGCMRRIYKKMDPHKEKRPAYKFHMDTITWSHRAYCGSKYEVMIKCAMSDWYSSLYLYAKSDSIHAFKQWVTSMRNDPSFQNMGYKAVQAVQLDNAAEWGLDYAAWSSMGADLGIEFIYSCTDRSNQTRLLRDALESKKSKSNSTKSATFMVEKEK